VPVNPTGTATLDVQVYVGDPVLVGEQIINQAQPAVVGLMSYGKTYAFNYPDNPYDAPAWENDVIYWTYALGGSDADWGVTPSDTGVGPRTHSYSSTEALAGGEGFAPLWEEAVYGDTHSQTAVQTKVMVLPAGQQSIGQTALYLVLAQVFNEDSGLQLAAGAVQFMNQLAGTSTEDVTNSDGSVWTEAMVSAPAGAQTEVTPIAAGDIDFTGMKTAKTKADWQNVVRNEILFYNGGIDIDYYHAANSFLSNRKYIKAVYSFYQMVYLEQPTEYYWAGLGKLAGAPVYAGLSDAQNVGLLTDFQQTIMQMNIDILNDLAWQFEAYRKGGLNALEEINAVTHNTTVLDIAPWREIDQGIQQNNQALILEGNEDLLSREQQQILPDDYAVLSTFDTVLMSIFAKCPVWDSSSEPYYLRDFNTVMFDVLDYSSANVANTANRWTWITAPTYGIWDTWVNLSSSNQVSQVSADLRTRAATYSTSSLFTLY
jgi:hypothetical protein